jgi:hypothetical protein
MINKLLQKNLHNVQSTFQKYNNKIQTPRKNKHNKKFKAKNHNEFVNGANKKMKIYNN